MGEIFTIIVTELAKNVPAIILAAVAGGSILMNARFVKVRWLEMNKKLDEATAAVRDVPDALQKLKEHDILLMQLKQEQHDSNLIARAYVTRDEVREGLGKQGGDLHEKINKLSELVTDTRARLEERKNK
jgi:hypothetical protein